MSDVLRDLLDNCKKERDKLRADLAAERERADKAEEWRENYKRAADIAHADLNAALAAMKVAREALAEMVQTQDEWEASVGKVIGKQPKVFDRAIDRGREALVQIDAVLGGGDE